MWSDDYCSCQVADIAALLRSDSHGAGMQDMNTRCSYCIASPYVRRTYCTIRGYTGAGIKEERAISRGQTTTQPTEWITYALITFNLISIYQWYIASTDTNTQQLRNLYLLDIWPKITIDKHCENNCQI